ncbi:hypothetical protein [Hoeflea poritis]|uniref:DUF3619 domain-containing protein n=1 Tax=Hoeflea poritis TaxID=2993659 RepID=A0ABT4VHG7_9HYPH|nr:hypothetical protein [Hoeflea poritis]MDA4844120.1 hypothetical protein [Hoeflea poritis]
MDDRLEQLIDLHGADLNSWPDRELAQEARQAAMSDPQFRRRLDAARRVDKSLSALASALDDSTAMRTSSSAMQAALLDRIDAQAQRRRAFSWRSLSRLAAGIVVACGLGIGVGQIIPDQDIAQNDAFDELLLGSGDSTAGPRSG